MHAKGVVLLNLGFQCFDGYKSICRTASPDLCWALGRAVSFAVGSHQLLDWHSQRRLSLRRIIRKAMPILASLEIDFPSPSNGVRSCLGARDRLARITRISLLGNPDLSAAYANHLDNNSTSADQCSELGKRKARVALFRPGQMPIYTPVNGRDG